MAARARVFVRVAAPPYHCRSFTLKRWACVWSVCTYSACCVVANQPDTQVCWVGGGNSAFFLWWCGLRPSCAHPTNHPSIHPSTHSTHRLDTFWERHAARIHLGHILHLDILLRRLVAPLVRHAGRHRQVGFARHIQPQPRVVERKRLRVVQNARVPVASRRVASRHVVSIRVRGREAKRKRNPAETNVNNIIQNLVPARGTTQAHRKRSTAE